MSRFETVAALNVRSGPGTNHEILDTLEKGDVVEEVITAGWCPIEMDDSTIGWISEQYLIPATELPAAPAKPVVTVPSGEPAWIQWARKQLGQKEVPGPGDNPVIAAWYHLTTLPESMWHDATAWCAVFVNAGLMLNNIKTIRSARAVDWLGWGKTVTVPQKGDVVVFDFGGGDHHVAYYLADADSNRIQVIGGNQSDAVTIATYPKSFVMGYRRAA